MTDSVKPHACGTIRDPVVERRQAYDQFIREQLAGTNCPISTADASSPPGSIAWGSGDRARRPAIGYVRRLDDIVTTTGQAFLGLTVNCKPLHDHKIDPITQRDYYSLLAFPLCQYD